MMHDEKIEPHGERNGEEPTATARTGNKDGLYLEANSREFAEFKRKVVINEIDSSHPDFENQVRKYLQCEIKNGFTVLATDKGETLEKKTRLRMLQIKEGGMCVWYVEDDQEKEFLATSVLVIDTAVPSIAGQQVMDKRFDPSYQAWAAGTVVDDDPGKGMRNAGVGTMLGERQHNKARELGRHEVLTSISSQNPSSVTVRMNHLGYRLVGVQEDNTPQGGAAGYHYVKNLDTELTLPRERVRDRVGEVQRGEIREYEWDDEVRQLIDEGKNPERLLVDPQNASLIRLLTENGYVGTYLLRPKDFATFDNPFLKISDSEPQLKFIFEKDDGKTKYKQV